MTNTEPVAWMNPANNAVITATKKKQVGVGGDYPSFSIPLHPESALQAERERAEKLENEATADAWILSDLVSKLTEAEAELAALEVKTWNAAIEAAAEGFELDDGHYYDQVRESILRLKK